MCSPPESLWTEPCGLHSSTPRGAHKLKTVGKAPGPLGVRLLKRHQSGAGKSCRLAPENRLFSNDIPHGYRSYSSSFALAVLPSRHGAYMSIFRTWSPPRAPRRSVYLLGESVHGITWKTARCGNRYQGRTGVRSRAARLLSTHCTKPCRPTESRGVSVGRGPCLPWSASTTPTGAYPALNGGHPPRAV